LVENWSWCVTNVSGPHVKMWWWIVICCWFVCAEHGQHCHAEPCQPTCHTGKSLITIIIIIIITEMIFMVLSSWQSNCESSPGSFDECRLSAEVATNPQTKPTTICIHRRHLLLLSPKADTHFTVPRRVEGWVDLVGLLHTKNKVPPPGVEPRHIHPPQYQPGSVVSLKCKLDRRRSNCVQCTLCKVNNVIRLNR